MAEDKGPGDAYYDLALRIEKAMLKGEDLCGVLLDVKKCFDTVPWEITFRLVEKMGMDVRVTRPLRNMYVGLRRRFKVLGTLGKEFTATNGILQGCAISVVLLNALIAVWVKAVEAETQCKATAFADDTKMVAVEGAQLEAGIRVSEEFSDATTLEYAVEPEQKCSSFAVGSQELQLDIRGVPIPQLQAFMHLGAGMSTTADRTEVTELYDKRAEKGTKKAERMQNLPLGFKAMATMAASSIITTGLHAVETGEPSKNKLDALGNAIVRGIWGDGRKYRCKRTVLTLLTPMHRTDPSSFLKYQRLLALATHYRKSAEMAELITEVRLLHASRSTPSALKCKDIGPVGLVLSTLRLLKWRWNGGLVLQKGRGATQATLNLETGDKDVMKHDLREWMRQKNWQIMQADKRDDTGGTAVGVDYKTINRVWEREPEEYRAGTMRGIIAGSIVTQVRLSEQHQNKKKGMSPTCKHCGQAPETHAPHVVGVFEDGGDQERPALREPARAAKGELAGVPREVCDPADGVSHTPDQAEWIHAGIAAQYVRRHRAVAPAAGREVAEEDAADGAGERIPLGMAAGRRGQAVHWTATTAAHRGVETRVRIADVCGSEDMAGVAALAGVHAGAACLAARADGRLRAVHRGGHGVRSEEETAGTDGEPAHPHHE